MEYIQTSLFGKTSPEPCQATAEKISEQFLKSSRRPQSREPLYLDLRGSGGQAGASWETGGPLLGEYSTHSFGECPSAAVESRLSWILQEDAPLKYYLSAKACRGILTRAERRGKKLPSILDAALRTQAEDAEFQSEIAAAR